MTIIYLLMVHQHPAQLKQLVQRLCGDSQASVIVHIDGRVNVERFREQVTFWRSQVVFVEKRFATSWGSFESCRAILELMRIALEKDPTAMYVLLSGSDYPIVSDAELHRVLSRHELHMELWPMPDHEHDKPLWRLTRFYMPARSRSSLVSRGINRCLRFFPPRPVGHLLRKYPPYGGGSWWAMTGQVAAAVLSLVDRDPMLYALFARSRNADEMFFQTAVVAAGVATDRGPAVTRAIWRRSKLPGAPLTMTGPDLLAALRTREPSSMFLRKFPWPDDEGLYAEVDAWVRASETR